MIADPCHLLFCDYDGEFRFADILSSIGYMVDQIRPDALRQVSVGDHHLYIFSFSTESSLRKALKTCEKLKLAELRTPILLLNLAPPTPEFMNHQSSPQAANAYVANPASENVLLDALDRLVGCPIPASLKGSLQVLAADKERQEVIELYRKRISDLEVRISELQGAQSENIEQALEVQRNLSKQKLQALMKGEKQKLQTETERLKFSLSEVEAKLLEREARIKQLEEVREKQKIKLEEITQTHEKAQQTLREFYQNKLKALEAQNKDDPKSNAG